MGNYTDVVALKLFAVNLFWNAGFLPEIFITKTRLSSSTDFVRGNHVLTSRSIAKNLEIFSSQDFKQRHLFNYLFKIRSLVSYKSMKTKNI